jgi:hypothetical protein
MSKTLIQLSLSCDVIQPHKTHCSPPDWQTEYLIFLLLLLLYGSLIPLSRKKCDMLRAFVKSFAPRTGLLTLAGLLSLSVVPAISHAAIAHIDYIVATRKQNNPPFGIFYNEIEWRIDLTWTGTPRRGAEHLW